MIGLTVKNIIIKKQLNFFFKVLGVLFCTIFEETGLSQCRLAGLLMCSLQGAIITKTNFRIENYNCIISQNKM